MLIRVLEIPAPTGNFHFGGGEPQTFIEVDWFQDDTGPDPEGPTLHDYPLEEFQSLIIEHVKMKNYYQEGKAYLILHPDRTFTINYDAT